MSHLKQICTFTLLLLSFFIGSDGIAQLAIGQWRDHLSYRKGISVTQDKDNMYCATESGLFLLKKSDNSIERLSKINGLSDIGVNTIRYNNYNNTLLIAYQNANIDLLSNNTIFNISDIKRSIITAKKTIHNIHYRNELAYLACGFGIVVLDMDKKEIRETYYIGVNGGYINVHEVTSDGNYLYAATDSGVYHASLNSPNLADFKAWTKFTSLPNGTYNTIASFAGKIFTNYSAPASLGWGHDTIFTYNGILWDNFLADTIGLRPVRKIEESQGKLLVNLINYTDVYDADSLLGSMHSQTIGINIDPYQSIVDLGNQYTYWIADNYNGLTKAYNFSNVISQSYAPNGPNTSGIYIMTFAGKDLWVARGDRGETWTNVYNKAEAYTFSSEAWSSVTSANIPALDTIWDAVSIAVDPNDKDHVYLGALGAGLVEIDNGTLVKVWNETNSSLQSTGWSSSVHWVGIFGLAFDQDGNLWVSNSTAAQPLSVRKKSDGSWQSFNFSSLAINPTTGSILVDRSNQKWMLLPRGVGLVVFNDNGTWATGDDKMKKLSSLKGSGSLPSNEIICLTEDLDGEVWAGTDKGIAVFYCADQVLTSGCEAQQILIQQDGHTQILLETEVVNAIAIDGANRKWIGTQNSGAYLMSPDGTVQIKHFTVDNSPLLSDEIRSIVIDPITGEVFFGTGKGIISYRNDATEGLEDFTNVYTFPNPVKPGYEGPIAITGLVENADVKITDVSGTLVYQTKSLGGQAIWYGKNFDGEKASSGVYLVFCSNEDGSKTFITKILLVN